MERWEELTQEAFSRLTPDRVGDAFNEFCGDNPLSSPTNIFLISSTFEDELRKTLIEAGASVAISSAIAGKGDLPSTTAYSICWGMRIALVALAKFQADCEKWTKEDKG